MKGDEGREARTGADTMPDSTAVRKIPCHIRQVGVVSDQSGGRTHSGAKVPKRKGLTLAGIHRSDTRCHPVLPPRGRPLVLVLACLGLLSSCVPVAFGQSSICLEKVSLSQRVICCCFHYGMVLYSILLLPRSRTFSSSSSPKSTLFTRQDKTILCRHTRKAPTRTPQ